MKISIKYLYRLTYFILYFKSVIEVLYIVENVEILRIIQHTIRKNNSLYVYCNNAILI